MKIPCVMFLSFSVARVKEFDRFLHAYGKSKVAAKTIVSNESRRNSFKMKYSEIFGNNELAKLEVSF